MPWKLGNTVIKAGSSWVDASKIRHPSNWSVWSDDQKKAVGLTWSDPSPQDAVFDNRFYSGRQADGTLIEKSLADTLWVDESGNPVKLINVECQWSHLGDTSQPFQNFIANPDDPEEHGRALYAALINGDHGTVADE